MQSLWLVADVGRRGGAIAATGSRHISTGSGYGQLASATAARGTAHLDVVVNVDISVELRYPNIVVGVVEQCR